MVTLFGSASTTERKTPSKTKTKAYRGHIIGCPTKYRPEFPQMMIDHFSRTIVEDTEYEDKESGVVKVATIRRDFPTLAGFCITIGVCRDTLYEWANKVDENGVLFYPDFSYAMRLAKEYQEDVLVTRTLNGEYVASFSSFVAKNLLGWHDQKDVTISGNPDKPLVQISTDMSPEQAALIYKESLEND